MFEFETDQIGHRLQEMAEKWQLIAIDLHFVRREDQREDSNVGEVREEVLGDSFVELPNGQTTKGSERRLNACLRLLAGHGNDLHQIEMIHVEFNEIRCEKEQRLGNVTSVLDTIANVQLSDRR